MLLEGGRINAVEVSKIFYYLGSRTKLGTGRYLMVKYKRYLCSRTMVRNAER